MQGYDTHLLLILINVSDGYGQTFCRKKVHHGILGNITCIIINVSDLFEQTSLPSRYHAEHPDKVHILIGFATQSLLQLPCLLPIR
jgi:hypothetical protein